MMDLIQCPSCEHLWHLHVDGECEAIMPLGHRHEGAVCGCNQPMPVEPVADVGGGLPEDAPPENETDEYRGYRLAANSGRLQMMPPAAPPEDSIASLPPLDVTPEEKREAFDFVAGLTSADDTCDELTRLAEKYQCRERQLIQSRAEVASLRETISPQAEDGWREQLQRLRGEAIEELRQENESLKATISTLQGIERDRDDWARECGKVQMQLAEMTKDRDLWQGDHNEDCPNRAEADSLLDELAKAQATISTLQGVIRDYRCTEEHHGSNCDNWTEWGGMDNRCFICKQADALLAPKPVAPDQPAKEEK